MLPAVKTHYTSQAGTNCTKCSNVHLPTPDRPPSLLYDHQTLQRLVFHHHTKCYLISYFYVECGAIVTHRYPQPSRVSTNTPTTPIPPPTGSRAQTGI